jgi:hypothetical protein
VRLEGYMLRMLKHLSARGSLFLFVRTHHHLAYYFNLDDTRSAANQNGVLSFADCQSRAKVVVLHPARAASQSQ